MTELANKVIFITGASRGIGRAMALRFAQDGAKIVIASKSDKPHPKLGGTIHTVADEIEKAGGQALPIKVDVRDEQMIQAAVAKTIDTFGQIDVLINNASALSLTPTLDTPMKRFDLMHSVNVRGTFATSQACLPYLIKADNPHILNISPPLNMKPHWFKDFLAYSMSKYGMSMCTLGMAAEFKEKNVAVNSLWPQTSIATDAIKVHLPDFYASSRKPDIMADAAYAVVTSDSKTTTGHFFTDEEVLSKQGVDDFSHYALDPSAGLTQDLFLDD